MSDNIDTFSIRIERCVIEDFRQQAKTEQLTQGKLFKKILSLYLGKYSLDEEKIPFSIHLFRFDSNGGNLRKKIYEGYGTPLYFSDAFRFHGWVFSSDKKPMFKDFGGDNYSFANRQLDYRHFFSSELSFFPTSLRNCPWVDGKLSSQGSEEFFSDFGINLLGFYFMSVFRVFREWTTGSSSHILVNEQMYLVDSQRYCDSVDLLQKRQLGLASSNNDEDIFFNPYGTPRDSLEPIRAEWLPFAVSTLYRIDDTNSGEEILRLNRKYLNHVDVINLKNVLKPRVSKSDKDIDEILAEYSFKNK